MLMYTQIARTLAAYKNCVKSGNVDWEEKHEDTLRKMMDDAPSGSGVDHGTKLDLDKSTEEKLVFNVDFHHMDEHGSYDGWSVHTVVVTPSLAFGFKLKVTGVNRNDIKDYLGDLYHEWLSKKIQIKIV